MPDGLSKHIDPLEWFSIGAYATDTRTAVNAIEKIMINLGAESIGFAFEMPKQVGVYPSSDEMFGHFLNREWHEFYHSNQHLMQHDTFAPYLATSESPIFVDVRDHEKTLPVPKTSMSKDQKAFFNLVMDFGLKQTIAMSFFDRLSGRMSIMMANMTMGGSGDMTELSDNHMSEFHLASRFFLESLQVNNLTEGELPVRLSRRERDCLHWAAVGRSTKEIADIMKLSDNTVNEYFASAQRKLKASNRVQAVVRAYQINLIQP